MHKRIVSDKAPLGIGPYSQAIMTEGRRMLFVSGQIPLNHISMQVEAQGIREQTRVVLQNLYAILQEAGADRQTVVKTTVYLKDMNDFAVMNEEYAQFFAEHKPARVCVEVARLPKDVLVEIDAIAVL